jgi:hypothetical protein
VAFGEIDLDFVSTHWQISFSCSAEQIPDEFLSRKGEPKSLKVDPAPPWLLLSYISFSLNSGSAGRRRRRWQRMVSARTKK